MIDMGRSLAAARTNGVPYVVTPVAADGYRIFADRNLNGRAESDEVITTRRLPGAQLNVRVSFPPRIVLESKGRDAHINLANDDGTARTIDITSGRLGIFKQSQA